MGTLAPVATASRTSPSRDIAFTRYDGAALSAGSHRGTVVTGEGIGFGTATGKAEYDGRTYERARWTAPW